MLCCCPFCVFFLNYLSPDVTKKLIEIFTLFLILGQVLANGYHKGYIMVIHGFLLEISSKSSSNTILQFNLTQARNVFDLAAYDYVSVNLFNFINVLKENRPLHGTSCLITSGFIYLFLIALKQCFYLSAMVLNSNFN